MHSITTWNFAKSPNYDTNCDMIYPYSEVPYIGNYKLVKIPFSSGDILVPNSELIDHVDYWGEGKISVAVGSSGYPNCYNVNHQYQLVSNGTDRDRKIPNRIPVISYTNCDTSSYIKDNSVKLVTLMGAPINKSCAKDIARMVNGDLGKVVVYGFSGESADIKNLENELRKKNLLFCHGYKLSELLKTITLFDADDHRGYLNFTDLGGEFFQNVIDGSYEIAINISKTLQNSGNGALIADVVARLLREGKRNAMNFAYKLWNSDSKAVVENYFPIAFKLIFNQEHVKIINKTYHLSLDSDINSDKERIVFGSSKNEASEDNGWKFFSVWDEKHVRFQILNTKKEMYLKLEGGNGDKKVKGSLIPNESNSQWFLDPIKVDDDMSFYIINKDFNEGLTLSENADSNDNKQVLGHHETVYGEPAKYGWYITPF